MGISYLAIVLSPAKERTLDWGLTDDEMFYHEKLLSLAIAAGIISTWVLGMYRAHLAGSRAWFIICLIFFPAAYAYTMAINKKHET